MISDLNMLQEIIESFPPTELVPHAFFVARSGVLTLVFEGFSPTLLRIKDEIERRFIDIEPENPGSLWPKATLAALHDGQRHNLGSLQVLRDVCDNWNASIQASPYVLTVDALSLVVFLCRSLEERLFTTTIPLRDTRPPEARRPSSDHFREVTEILAQFHRSRLDVYLADVQRPGYHVSHYREAHTEATLVYDLPVQETAFLKGFREQVDRYLPGYYAWFSAESLHVTLRNLVRSGAWR